MARRRKSRVRHTRKRSAFSSCLSRALKGKRMKTKKARKKVMKAAMRKCAKKR